MRVWPCGITIWLGLLAGTAPTPGQEEAERLQQSGFLDSDGERLYYQVTGAGEAVVLTHGYGGNHAIWYQQVLPLARRFRVVTWDQRGFGRSSNRGDQAGPDAFARDLEALLDRLVIDRAHLVGQSMGGWTVVAFATRHPERVRSLVLADTLGGIYDEKARAAMGRLVGTPGVPLEQLPPHRHPAIGERLSSEDPTQAFLYRQIGGLGPPPPATIPARLLAADYTAAARQLELPVLLVVGSDDSLFPPALVEAAARQLAHSRVVEIAGAGHSPYFERPEEWNRVVLEFLEARSAAERRGSESE